MVLRVLGVVPRVLGVVPKVLPRAGHGPLGSRVATICGCVGPVQAVSLFRAFGVFQVPGPEPVPQSSEPQLSHHTGAHHCGACTIVGRVPAYPRASTVGRTPTPSSPPREVMGEGRRKQGEEVSGWRDGS